MAQKQVQVVTMASIQNKGASGGQTEGMIRENAITGMSEKVCSSCELAAGFLFFVLLFQFR